MNLIGPSNSLCLFLETENMLQIDFLGNETIGISLQSNTFRQNDEKI